MTVLPRNVLLVGLLLASQLVMAKELVLSPGLILNKAGFAIGHSTEDIPRPVKHSLAQLFKERRFEMANPESKFAESDAIGNSNGARRRLIFVASNGKYCFVHYELGGYGVARYVALFEYSPEAANLRWAASTKGVRLKSLTALQQALQMGRVTVLSGTGMDVVW